MLAASDKYNKIKYKLRNNPKNKNPRLQSEYGWRISLLYAFY